MRSPIPLGTIDGRSGLSWLHRSHAPRQPLKGGPCDEPRYQEAGALSFRLWCGTPALTHREGLGNYNAGYYGPLPDA